VFALVGGLLLMMTVVPVLAVAVGSFMKLTGGSFTDGPWTLANWRSMIDGGTLRGLGDTVFLGVLSALFAMAILTVIAYLSVRPRLQGRGMLEALVRVPGSIPGIVWGLGWLFLLLAGTVPFSESRPLGSLYGGIGAMVLVVTIAGITVGVQIIGVRIAQVGAGIEEAAWTAGASRLHTVRSVLLPLVGPAILVVGVITFSTAVRATSLIALLAPHEARPLSLVQMDQMLAGGFGQASVGGVFLAVLGVGAVLIGRALGLRTGGGLR
jgi:iron(III) transport system permease protein